MTNPASRAISLSQNTSCCTELYSAPLLARRSSNSCLRKASTSTALTTQVAPTPDRTGITQCLPVTLTLTFRFVGYTNLMMAIDGGKGERATLLIRAGADVTKVNAAGLSAFHIAAAKPALIQLKQLAQAGAESIDGLRAALKAKGDTGKTPKDCAKDPQTRAWLERLEAASDGELELFACGKSLETAAATLAPPTPPRTLGTYAPIAAGLLSTAVDVATWGVDSVTREFYEALDDAAGTLEYIRPGGDDSKVLRNWLEAPVWANSGALGF